MYESHFGLTGSPFALNPDPAFYFDSKGHANALSYLKFGVYQGEGFIVVTGDIGAGKTTLVRTLLSDLDSEKIVAAQVVSTQLESTELLYSIATAFGVPVQGTGKAQLLATLEAFLTATAARGRRALLVVDEAQNLHLQSIEELRMLSNFQLGNRALLQSFLVGQPELRKLLESKALEQLRQRVIASCHLGPLGDGETRAYIEHRLKKAGWSGVPRFEPEAFDAIHRWSGGVPRRINLLCNRTFLAAFLAGEDLITAKGVEQIARELRGEVGEAAGAAPQVMAAGTSPQTQSSAPTLPLAAAPAALQGDMSRRELSNGASLAGALLVVGDTPAALRKAGALAKVLAAQGGMPPVVLVNPGEKRDVEMSDEDQRWLPLPDAEIHLGVPQATFAQSAAARLVGFESVLDEVKPCAVFTLGSSDAILACALGAMKRGHRLVRIDAGQRSAVEPVRADLNAVLIERMAEVLFTSKLTAHYTLYREGIPSDSVHCVGSLVNEVLQAALPASIDHTTVMARFGLPGTLSRAPRGYGLVTLQTGRGEPASRLSNVLTTLGALGSETPLVWPCDEQTRAHLEQMGVEKMLADANIALVSRLGYLETLGLLVGATYLVAGPERTMLEEAVTIGIPCMTVGDDVAMPTKMDDGWNTVVGCDSEQALRVAKEILALGVRFREVKVPMDSDAALRMSQHVRTWFARARGEPVVRRVV